MAARGKTTSLSSRGLLKAKPWRLRACTSWATNGALSGRVVLLTVIQPPVITSEYAPLMENISEIVAAGEKTAAKKLAKLAEQLEAKSIAAETLQFNGAPVTNIVEQAEKLSADYIVMGSHGHSAVYDLLVGSTTHGVLMRSKCPVVIVPPENPKAKP